MESLIQVKGLEKCLEAANFKRHRLWNLKRISSGDYRAPQVQEEYFFTLFESVWRRRQKLEVIFERVDTSCCKMIIRHTRKMGMVFQISIYFGFCKSLST